MTATRQEGAIGGGRPPAGELLVYWDDDPSDSDSDNDKEDHSSVSGDEGELEDEVEIWGSFGRLSLQRASYREIMNQGLYASTGSAVLDALNEAQSGMKKRFADQQEQDEDQSVMTWRKSIRKSLTNMSKNMEVFEPGYRATNGQNAIIAKLENQLFGPDTAFRKMSRRRSSGGTSSSNLSGPDLAHVVLHSHAMTIDSEAHSFIRYSGQTVLLKKGPVTYQKVIEEKKGLFTFKGSESSGSLNEFYVEEPRELILFNNSILIASLEAVANNESRDIWNRIVESLPINKYVDACEKLCKVEAIVDLEISNYSHKHVSESDNDNDDDRLIENGFRIVFAKKSFTFECVLREDKKAWMTALEMAVLESKKHRSLEGHLSDNADRITMTKYDMIRKCIFSAVINGDDSMLLRLLRNKGYYENATKLNRLDKCGYSLCHYAVFKDQMSSLEILLNSGADPNVLDKMNKPPGAYARKQETLDILIAKGANPDQLPRISAF